MPGPARPRARCGLARHRNRFGEGGIQPNELPPARTARGSPTRSGCPKRSSATSEIWLSKADLLRLLLDSRAAVVYSRDCHGIPPWDAGHDRSGWDLALCGRLSALAGTLGRGTRSDECCLLYT